jgi:hypothetical protein
MKIGDKAKYKKHLKALKFGKIGEISVLLDDFCIIRYPDNLGTNQVYAHSANYDEIEL